MYLMISISGWLKTYVAAGQICTLALPCQFIMKLWFKNDYPTLHGIQAHDLASVEHSTPPT